MLITSAENKQTLSVGLNTLHGKENERQTDEETDRLRGRRACCTEGKYMRKEISWAWLMEDKEERKPCLICRSFRSWRSRIVSSHIPQEEEEEEKSRGFFGQLDYIFKEELTQPWIPFISTLVSRIAGEISNSAQEKTKNTQQREKERSNLTVRISYCQANRRDTQHGQN